MRILKYKVKAGAVVQGVNAKNAHAIGKEIERIAKANDNQVTPRLLITSARKKQAMLHPCFTWNEKAAAEKCRESEARNLLNSIEAEVVIHESDGPRITPAFVNVYRKHHVPGVYMPMFAAMREPDSQADALRDAWNSLQAWVRKYENIKELAGIINMIKSLKKPKRKKKPKDKAS